MRRSDGRIVETSVRLPVSLIAEAERLAALAGLDVDTFLGDLVAEQLPDAFAEAARLCLQAGRQLLQRQAPVELDAVRPAETPEAALP